MLPVLHKQHTKNLRFPSDCYNQITAIGQQTAAIRLLLLDSRLLQSDDCHWTADCCNQTTAIGQQTAAIRLLPLDSRLLQTDYCHWTADCCNQTTAIGQQTAAAASICSQLNSISFRIQQSSTQLDAHVTYAVPHREWS